MTERFHKTKWHCIYNPGRQGYELFLSIFSLDNYWYRMKDVIFEKVDDLSMEYPKPPFVLEEDQAQQLMDELWTAGLRPTEGHGSAGQIGAVERHLEDMRKIVFESFLGDCFIPIQQRE